MKSASPSVTGVGFYEARLNGAKVGRKVLDPSPTDYTKRVRMQLQPGERRVLRR